MNKNTLHKDFNLRKDFFSNRSSAIFPIYFQSKKNDLILSWLNYWVIKNDMNHSSLAVVIRIYDYDGALFTRAQINLEENNNALSVRSFLQEEIFEGMVEIEIISTDNIRFTFPAIIGLYKTGSLYSCVHSAGRYKGTDENHTESITEETNWTCKFSPDITPFFHYVNGNQDKEVNLKVNLKSKEGITSSSIEINEHMKSFSSKVYFVDEIMPNISIENGMFISVECSNDSVFRRMVVGNYHKTLKHMEVTHSFPKQELKDYCPKNENGAESFLALYNDHALDLTARVFPTNYPGEFMVNESNQSYQDQALDIEQKSKFLPKGYGLIDMETETRTKVLWLKGVSVPSRLNCNFLYKVKGVNSIFSTDIATGAKSSVYPPKHSHWGSGVMGNGYDFVLMIRNLNHNRDCTIAKGTLSVFGFPFEIEHKVEINADSSSSIRLSDILDKKFNDSLTHSEVIFTWFLKLDQPNSETFWVSFRRDDGCIVGEHGF